MIMARTGSALRFGVLLLPLGLLGSGCASQSAPAPRSEPVATPTPEPPPRPPAASVPDQPFLGQPASVDRPYVEILRLRESGQSNEALLEKVRAGNVFYSLSIFEIQKLRAAGVSETVIEAMLASGRAVPTPTPTRRAS
jgi:hypothetical protein